MSSVEQFLGVVAVGTPPPTNASVGWVETILLLGILVAAFVVFVRLAERIALREELDRWLSELLPDEPVDRPSGRSARPGNGREDGAGPPGPLAG